MEIQCQIIQIMKPSTTNSINLLFTRDRLHENCPNTELFLVRISCIRTEYRKYGPEITPYLDNFHTVIDTYDRRTNAEFYPQRGALEYCF